MVDEQTNQQPKDTPGDEAKETAEKAEEPKIMCYISKEMVPLSETVEVEYAPGKKFRVLPRYIKFETDSEPSLR